MWVELWWIILVKAACDTKLAGMADAMVNPQSIRLWLSMKYSLSTVTSRGGRPEYCTDSTVQESNRATLGMSIVCSVRHGRLSGNVGLQANPEHVCVQLNMDERSGHDSLAPV